MRNYLNGEARTKVAYLRDIDILYKNLIESDNLSKEEKTEFKHAYTRHRKGIALMKKRLPDDFKKIERLLSDNIIVMKPKVQELINNGAAITITDDRLKDILEVLINDHCVGCTSKDWKNCHIWKLNDDLDVSSLYNHEEGTCEFSYMAEMEKAKNPTYGTIFKEV